MCQELTVKFLHKTGYMLSNDLPSCYNALAAFLTVCTLHNRPFSFLPPVLGQGHFYVLHSKIVKKNKTEPQANAGVARTLRHFRVVHKWCN